MKKVFIFILLVATIFSCKKELGNLKLVETILGGCALEKGTPLKSIQFPDVNKVTYTISNGNLDLFVGFNATCCGQYSTSSEIKGDTIFVKIATTKFGNCDCIC
jgi:hypothetical protein